MKITGTGFGIVPADVKVNIDGIACAVTAVTNTEITCTTGARPTTPVSTSF